MTSDDGKAAKKLSLADTQKIQIETTKLLAEAEEGRKKLVEKLKDGSDLSPERKAEIKRKLRERAAQCAHELESAKKEAHST